MSELDGLAALLEAHDIRVLRPQDLEDVNQIFARDVGVVIDDRFVAMRMISDRAAEWQGIEPLLKDVRDSHVLTPPAGVRRWRCDADEWRNLGGTQRCR